MQQIIGYAKYLGIDVKNDRDLLYIAKEGLTAPLPAHWEIIVENGTPVYLNTLTNLKQVDHPLDEFYRYKYKTLKA